MIIYFNRPVAEKSQNGVSSFLDSIPRGNATYPFVTQYKSYLNHSNDYDFTLRKCHFHSKAQRQYRTYWDRKRHRWSQKSRRITGPVFTKFYLGLTTYSVGLSKILNQSKSKNKTLCGGVEGHAGKVNPFGVGGTASPASHQTIYNQKAGIKPGPHNYSKIGETKRGGDGSTRAFNNGKG